VVSAQTGVKSAQTLETGPCQRHNACDYPLTMSAEHVLVGAVVRREVCANEPLVVTQGQALGLPFLDIISFETTSRVKVESAPPPRDLLFVL
jgi:hypothetical protein